MIQVDQRLAPKVSCEASDQASAAAATSATYCYVIVSHWTREKKFLEEIRQTLPLSYETYDTQVNTMRQYNMNNLVCVLDGRLRGIEGAFSVVRLLEIGELEQRVAHLLGRLRHAFTFHRVIKSFRIEQQLYHTEQLAQVCTCASVEIRLK